MAQPRRIFICYSRAQESVLTDVLNQLRPMLRGEGTLEPWSDRDLEAGQKWDQTIRQTIDDCTAALVLVSPELLNSRYVMDVELPRLIARSERKEILLTWLSVVPCPVEHVQFAVEDYGGGHHEVKLTDLQGLNQPSESLSSDPPTRAGQLKAMMVRFAELLRAREQSMRARQRGPGSVLLIRLSQVGELLEREYLDQGQSTGSPERGDYDPSQLADLDGRFGALFPGGEEGPAMARVIKRFADPANGNDPTPFACALRVQIETQVRELVVAPWNELQWRGQALAPTWVFEVVRGPLAKVTVGLEDGLGILASQVGILDHIETEAIDSASGFGIVPRSFRGKIQGVEEEIRTHDRKAALVVAGELRKSKGGWGLVFSSSVGGTSEVQPVETLLKHSSPILLLIAFGEPSVAGFEPEFPMPPGKLVFLLHAGPVAIKHEAMLKLRERIGSWIGALARLAKDGGDPFWSLVDALGPRALRIFSTVSALSIRSALDAKEKPVLARVWLDRVAQRNGIKDMHSTLRSDSGLRCALIVGSGTKGNHVELLGRHGQEAIQANVLSVRRIAMPEHTLRGAAVGDSEWKHAIAPHAAARTLQAALEAAASGGSPTKPAVLLLDFMAVRILAADKADPKECAARAVGELRDLVAYLRDKLAPNVPKSVRVMAIVALESELDLHGPLEAAFEEVSLDWRSELFRADLLDPMGHVKRTHIYDCALRLGAEHKVAREFADYLDLQHQGRYAETVEVLERAQRGNQWVPVLAELRGAKPKEKQ